MPPSPRRLPPFLLAASVLAAAPAAAQQPQADTARTHVVRRGDTLWDLAREYMGDPYLWPEIFQVNRDRVANPNRIYPTERLRIPGAQGVEEEVAQGPRRSVFYVEEQPGAARGGLTLEEELAAAPLVAPGEFYRAGVLLHARDVAAVGRVTEVVSPTVVPVRIPPQVQPYDRVFASVAGGVRPGDRLHLLHEGRVIEPYGRVYEPTGMATVEKVEAGTATLLVDQLFGRVQPGDLAVAAVPFRAPTRGATRAAGGPTGRLVELQSPHPVPQLHDLAFVDLGRQFGVREGDELEAYLPPKQESWGVRPEIRVARLRAVRVTARTATVQVIGMEQPALEPGVPVRLVAKTP